MKKAQDVIDMFFGKTVRKYVNNPVSGKPTSVTFPKPVYEMVKAYTKKHNITFEELYKRVRALSNGQPVQGVFKAIVIYEMVSGDEVEL